MTKRTRPRRARRVIPAALSVALALALPGLARAQGERNERSPELAESIEFPVSCDEEAADVFVEGVAYLHTFWYERAAETFADVVKEDSTCAMGYWGQAMSLFRPFADSTPPADRAAGRAAVARGLELAKTPRERAYLEAIRQYFASDTTNERTRLGAYADSMAALRRRNPDDREAAIFHALALIALGRTNPFDTTYAEQRRADSILAPLFQREPRHPGLAHYLILANDAPPLAPRGLEAARRYASAIAPDVAYAQHIPSHIFTRLGLWDDVIAANTRSDADGRRYEQRQHLDGLWDERAHADDYLVYAYLQEGRDTAAQRIVDEMAGVKRVSPANSLAAAYALAAIPARNALERGRWDEAARLTARPAPAWRGAEGITHFAQALGAARAGDTKRARAELDTLGRIARALARGSFSQAYWARQARIQGLAAGAWLAHAKHDSSEAIRMAQAAADSEDLSPKHSVTPGSVLPARELFGDLLYELGRPSDARRAYELSLARRPNRARSVFGAARAAERSGDRAAARRYYTQYLALMAHADGSRPELDVARQALAKP